MDNNNDFTQGSILKKMLLFMIPILGSLILQATYGAVDLLIVGRFGSTEGLSGVSTGSNVLNMATFVLSGLAMGTTVMISRYIGMDRKEKLGKVIGATIVLFTIIALAVTVLMIVFARQLAIVMQAPEEAVDLTVQYIRICGGGFLFITAYNTISAVFRGLGDSRSPLIFVAIACVVNVFGDLFFVAVLGMNVAGAALATVMAQAVSVVLSIVIMKHQELPFKLTRECIGFNSEIKNIIKIGSPIALQEFLTQLSFLALCAFVNKIGLDASSGYGIASKVQSFVMLIPSSLMQSMASFVSQNVGAGKEKRALHSMLTGMGIGFGIGIFVFLGVTFKGDIISSLFTEDSAVITRSWQYLRGFAPEAMVTSVLFSFMGYYNGHSKTLFVMLQGIAQTFIVRLPIAYFMSIQPGVSLTSIGLAAPCATVFGIAINVIYFIYFRKNIKWD